MVIETRRVVTFGEGLNDWERLLRGLLGAYNVLLPAVMFNGCVHNGKIGLYIYHFLLFCLNVIPEYKL